MAVRKASKKKYFRWCEKAVLLGAIGFVLYTFVKAMFYDIDSEQVIIAVIVLMTGVASCYLWAPHDADEDDALR
jgi:hypothetical protein